jgi:2-phosphoglycerate kinase
MNIIIFILFYFLFLIGYQILLLSGPPGLGKTTLAYVVARQAGYEVMEINARLATCQITYLLFLISVVMRALVPLLTIEYDLL